MFTSSAFRPDFGVLAFDIVFLVGSGLGGASLISSSLLLVEDCSGSSDSDCSLAAAAAEYFSFFLSFVVASLHENDAGFSSTYPADATFFLVPL